MCSSPSLGSDLVYEILSRVSLGTLGVCRAVNRQWNLITYEPTLVSLRSQRTETLHGYMVRWFKGVNQQTATFVSTTMLPRDSPISLEFLRPFGGSVKMEAAAHQGIVLCLRDNPKNHYIPQYIVCKPSTEQWVVIPNPKTRNMTVAIDLVVLRSRPTLHYKILRVSEYRLSSNNYTCVAFSCEVFDSETWKWKKLDDIKLPKEYSAYHFGSKVTVSGAACVLTKCPDGIFMFDVMEETWIILPLPFDKVDEDEWIELVKVEGKLGALRRDSMGRELWLMEDRRNNVWRKTKYEVTAEDAEEVRRNHYNKHLRSATAVFPFDCNFEPTSLGPPY